MIYKKSANFPYPLLTNESTAYKDCRFSLDIDLSENSNNYRFYFKYEITSKYIMDLIKNGQAQLVLVIQSKDNKFYYLGIEDKYIDIDKSRISLNKRTNIQMSIKLNNEVNFARNYDLSDFYSEFKDEIVVSQNSILGFSNVVTFDGSQRKPFDLFEKKLDKELKSSIKIELGNETIIINYRNEELQFNDLNHGEKLSNPYVYMGLQKALYRFINEYKGDKDWVDIFDIDPSDPLSSKLNNLMKAKLIEELNYENIDEVIDLITDGILEKYNNAIRGMIGNGD